MKYYIAQSKNGSYVFMVQLCKEGETYCIPAEKITAEDGASYIFPAVNTYDDFKKNKELFSFFEPIGSVSQKALKEHNETYYKPSIKTTFFKNSKSNLSEIEQILKELSKLDEVGIAYIKTK